MVLNICQPIINSFTVRWQGPPAVWGTDSQCPLSELTRFPYLLPPHHHLTTLIVKHTHALLFQAGVGLPWQHYDSPSGSLLGVSVWREYSAAVQFVEGPYTAPEMAPLPRVHVQDVPPYTVTGVDFTGALYVKQDNGGEEKVYICLFTCATSRAVHLEVVTNLSTEIFLLAFCHFAARRSLPQVMMSDNATTYTSVAEELIELLSSEEIRTVLSQEENSGKSSHQLGNIGNDSCWNWDNIKWPPIDLHFRWPYWSTTVDTSSPATWSETYQTTPWDHNF